MQDRLEKTIRQYSPMVYRLACARAGNRQDADEIYQEVFLRYIRKQPAFQNETHEKAWFLKVTANCANSLWRSARKWHTEPLPEDLLLETPEEIDLSHALGKLPPAYREVIHLFYYEELSTREIGQILHRRISTVRTQLTRARAILKKYSKEEYDEF